jgi:hypothetical protein
VNSRDRYLAALHAMQTGVAFKMHRDPGETSPKHLRVGVNSAMVEYAALVKLLIAKGIITEDEHYAALADAMEAERDFYAAELGPGVTLA